MSPRRVVRSRPRPTVATGPGVRGAALVPVVAAAIFPLASPACGTGAETVTVAAASSLTDVMPAIAEAHESSGGAEVQTTFDASGVLVNQIVEGAPADVFVSADRGHVRDLIDSGDAVGEPVVVARNRMVVVTPSGNPDGIAELGDLADADL